MLTHPADVGRQLPAYLFILRAPGTATGTTEGCVQRPFAGFALGSCGVFRVASAAAGWIPRLETTSERRRRTAVCLDTDDDDDHNNNINNNNNNKLARRAVPWTWRVGSCTNYYDGI